MYKFVETMPKQNISSSTRFFPHKERYEIFDGKIMTTKSTTTNNRQNLLHSIMFGMKCISLAVSLANVATFPFGCPPIVFVDSSLIVQINTLGKVCWFIRQSLGCSRSQVES